MPITIAAIRTGTEPAGPLPPGAFHRWLEEQLHCPKCDATYTLVTDFDSATGRLFERESDRPILMLRKAIALGHHNNHRVSHFETSGVTVREIGPPPPTALPPH